MNPKPHNPTQEPYKSRLLYCTVKPCNIKLLQKSTTVPWPSAAGAHGTVQLPIGCADKGPQHPGTEKGFSKFRV